MGILPAAGKISLIRERRTHIDSIVAWLHDRKCHLWVVNGGGRLEREYEQVAGYLDLAGLAAGSLVMFDLRRETSWQDRITVRDVIHATKQIRIFGC